jgi:chaperonin GroEL (HSP60 family)
MQLRSKHQAKSKWVGVDPINGKVADMAKLEVYEPLAVKVQALKSAGEAASMILKIDDVIAASRSKEAGAPKRPEESGKEEGEGES